MAERISLADLGITVENVVRNPAPALLYEHALRNEQGSVIAANGALIAYSGDKTGRCPNDKRIVREPDSEADIWWGEVNRPLSPASFEQVRAWAIDKLNGCPLLYCVDAFGGWDPEHQIKVRVLCARPYHALFMHNMLLRPTPEQLASFGKPDYVLINAGGFAADPSIEGVTSETSIALSLARGEFVILGSEYAGEMKKGVFTVMNYLMPKKGILSMHCSATQGAGGDTSVFFGLSGTGKTTLSADPQRKLIGDDEHCWTDRGVFNIEGGCYAKVIDLSAEAEPDIYRALRFGSLLENVVFDAQSREVDYRDTSLTKNTRGSYPIEYIEGARIPCVGAHPSNVIFLTCDAFGVLPPVSRLTPEQAMYHFMSGYTAKVAGTEVGIVDPQTTFSPCFGGPFLAWHPAKYAELLAAKMKQHDARAWLVNTGWSGGGFGVGARIKLRHTRAIVDAIHDGSLAAAATVEDPVFGVAVPTACAQVPAEILIPRTTWADKAAYDADARKLAGLFRDNFAKYAGGASEAVKDAGPRV